MKEIPYKTPEGFVDDPFIYVFDGAGLTDGVNALNLAQPILLRDDFILRRIVGVRGLTTTGFLYRSPTGSERSSAPFVPGNNYGVAPELLYPGESQIGFDLITVARAAIACGADPILAAARIGFQGVRRRRALASFAVGHFESAYRYYEIPFSYSFPLSVDWFHYVVAPNTESVRSFGLLISNYDFELQTIRVTRTNGVAAGTVPTTEEFSAAFYDASGYNRLSSGMLPLSWWNQRRAANFNSVFPVPSMVYPVGTEIRFDIQSNICNTDPDFPRTYQIDFQGVARKPV